MNEVIVVTAKFYTDGDFHIDADRTGLMHEADSHDYCGTFLCEDTDKAEMVLERIFRGIDANGFVFQWLIRAFGEAFSVLLENPESLRFGWCTSMGGNYGDTHLFMQTIQADHSTARNSQGL